MLHLYRETALTSMFSLFSVEEPSTHIESLAECVDSTLVHVCSQGRIHKNMMCNPYDSRRNSFETLAHRTSLDKHYVVALLLTPIVRDSGRVYRLSCGRTSDWMI